MRSTHRATLGLFTLLSACAGGARESGQLALQNARTSNGGANAPAGTVRASAPVIPDEAAPALRTLTSRGGVAASGNTGLAPVAPRPMAASPAPGGYIVRAAGTPRVDVAARAEAEAGGYRGGDSDDAAGRPVDAAPPPPPPSVAAVGPARAEPRAMAPSAGGGRAPGGGGGVATRAAPRGDGFGRGRAAGGMVMPAGEMAMGDIAAPPSAPAGAMRMPARPRPMPAGPVVQVAPVPTGRITIAVMPPSPPPPPPPPVEVVEDAQATAGVLTAASVGDADRRDNYLEYLARHAREREELSLDMTRRLRVRVVDANNRGVLAARVRVSGANLNASFLTHGDGVFDFFPAVHGDHFSGPASVEVEVESLRATAQIEVPAQGDAQELTVRLPAVVAPPPPVLDLAFAIDVTGSMGDELRYVNREVASIVQRVVREAPGTHVRVGATFYRDRFDDAVVQLIPFTTNVGGFASAMQGVTASGGGDYPEDMNAGLEAAMTRLNWSEGAATRVLVVIADAPPQRYADEQYTYRTTITEAGRRGIRLVPVAASGANRQVEYLFRAMGAATSTPYVYLTDDSGVGGHHMEADTDRVAVERFNDLLTRMLVSDLRGAGMHEPGALGTPNG